MWRCRSLEQAECELEFCAWLDFLRDEDRGLACPSKHPVHDN